VVQIRCDFGELSGKFLSNVGTFSGST
jgi:hypothetical protein